MSLTESNPAFTKFVHVHIVSLLIKFDLDLKKGRNKKGTSNPFDKTF